MSSLSPLLYWLKRLRRLVAVETRRSAPRTDPGVRFARTGLFGNPRFRTQQTPAEAPFVDADSP